MGTVRLKGDIITTRLQVFPWAAVTPPTVPPTGWMKVFDPLQRKPARQVEFSQVIVPQAPAAVTFVEGWSNTFNPPPPRPRRQQVEFSTNVFPFTQSGIFGWSGAFSSNRSIRSAIAEFSQQPLLPPAAAPQGWQSVFDRPRAATRPRPSDQGFVPFDTAQSAVVVYVNGWQRDWDKPVPLLRLIRDFVPALLPRIAPPAVPPFGWWQPIGRGRQYVPPRGRIEHPPFLPMAVQDPGTPSLINAYTEQVGANDDRVFRTWWMGMENGNIGEAVPRAPTRDRCWQVWGTFGGGSVVIEGTNDGTNYFALHDKLGNPAILLAPGIVEVIEIPHAVRPRVATGSGSTDVTAILTQRQGWR